MQKKTFCRGQMSLQAFSPCSEFITPGYEKPAPFIVGASPAIKEDYPFPECLGGEGWMELVNEARKDFIYKAAKLTTSANDQTWKKQMADAGFRRRVLYQGLGVGETKAIQKKLKKNTAWEKANGCVWFDCRERFVVQTVKHDYSKPLWAKAYLAECGKNYSDEKPQAKTMIGFNQYPVRNYTRRA